MTTLQLDAAIHRELSHIVGDEAMMEQALRALRRIRREHKKQLAQQGDSDEEIVDNLRQAFSELKEMKEGGLQSRPMEDLLHEL